MFNKLKKSIDKKLKEIRKTKKKHYDEEKENIKKNRNPNAEKYNH